MNEIEASRLVRMSKSDALGVLAQARLLPEQASSVVVALVGFAVGRALFELARNDEAIATFERALEHARGDLADRITVSLGAALLAGGDVGRARKELAEVQREATSPSIAQLASCQLALIELGAGDVASARDRLVIAIATLVRDTDEQDATARALGNLAYCYMSLGQLDVAASTYEEAIALGRDSGEGLVVAGSMQNLGYIDVMRWRFPDAIAALDEAHRAYLKLGAPARNLSSLLEDKAEAYALAGLEHEAVFWARQALAAVADGSNNDKIAEARLRLSVCSLGAGDLEEARELASLARSSFTATGRVVWAHRALALEVEALPAGQNVPRILFERSQNAIEELVELGWSLDALRLVGALGQALLLSSDAERAEQILSSGRQVVARTALGLVEQAFIAVLEAEAQGGQVQVPLADAHDLLVHHQVRLSDPELRAGVGRRRERFRQAALRYELRYGSAWDMLQTEERWRSLASQLPVVEPLRNPLLAQLSKSVRTAATAAEGPATGGDAEIRLASLEAELRTTSMGIPASGSGTVRHRELDAKDLSKNLHGRTFIEWLTLGPDLIRLVFAEGKEAECALLGPSSELFERATNVRSALARLLRPGLSASSSTSRWASLQQAALELGDDLAAGADVGGDLVLSPVGQLLGLPYRILFPHAGSIHLTASASKWMGKDRRPIAARAAVFVGPSIQFGSEDVTAIRGVFPAAKCYQGNQATTSTLSESLPSTTILHVAAHGVFRSDSPLFSSLQLSDGRFTLYDLPPDGAPDLVTLSTCDSGRARSYAGGAMIGAASAWIAAGARRVIAPVCAIPDEWGAAATARLYQHLVGSTPEQALTNMQADLSETSVTGFATSVAFQSWGCDVGPVSASTLEDSEET